jgi:3-methyladenine DNA glycosylase/8-oxoguanine DNA glycosylase
MPDGETLKRIVRAWSPWRSVGARILWHHYLSVRKKV